MVDYFLPVKVKPLSYLSFTRFQNRTSERFPALCSDRALCLRLGLNGRLKSFLLPRLANPSCGFLSKGGEVLSGGSLPIDPDFFATICFQRVIEI